MRLEIECDYELSSGELARLRDYRAEGEDRGLTRDQAELEACRQIAQDALAGVVIQSADLVSS